MGNMFRKLLRTFNPPRLICTVLFGEKHSVRVRLFVGGVIMVAGGSILKAPSQFDLHAWMAHLSFDVLGGAVHAFGVTPWLEAAIKLAVDDEAVAQAAAAAEAEAVNIFAELD